MHLARLERQLKTAVPTGKQIAEEMIMNEDD